MSRSTYSILTILLLLLILSCRSDARNLDAPEVHKEVYAPDVTSEMQTTAGGSDNVEAIEIEKPSLETSVTKEAKEEVVVLDPKETKAPAIASSQENDFVVAPPLPSKEQGDAVAVIENPKTELDNSPQSEPAKTKEEVLLETPSIEEKEEAKKEEPSIAGNIHDAWNTLLKKYVSQSGHVDYKGFKSDIGKLDSYLSALSQNQPKDSDRSKEVMAYYINVYNAATVKLILDNYPVASIKDINGGKPWDKVWIDLGDKKYSLNNIEHDILRPRFKDARVHFAVNCASASCPKIADTAFYGSNLDTFLDKLTREFVNDNDLNSIDAKSAQLSKLFQWYQGDFGNVIDFVNRYSDVKIKSSAKITYKDYKWNLNGK